MSIRKLIDDLRTAPPHRRKALCDELADQYQLTLTLRFQQGEEIEALEVLRLRHQKEIAALKDEIQSLKARL